MGDRFARSAAAEKMRRSALLQRDLVAGSDAMRARAEEYSPRFDLEDPGSYARRLALTFLFSGFKLAVEGLVGRVFRRPVVLGKDVPAEIAGTEPEKDGAGGSVGWWENLDLAGNAGDVVAQQLLTDGLVGPGLTHLLVDMQADGPESDRRPYWKVVAAESVLWWRSATVNGAEVPIEIGLDEPTTVHGDQGEEETVARVRILYVGRFELYEQRKSDSAWALIAEGPMVTGSGEVWDEIPIRTYYLNRTGFMQAEPLLLPLAEKNLEHWQGTSEQRAAVSFARRAVLHLSGVFDDGDGTPKALGSAVVYESRDPAGRMTWVEQSGTAVKVGQDDLDRIKEEMAVLGMLPLLVRPGTVTATEKAIDSADSRCTLDRLVVRLVDVLEGALALTAKWVGLPDGGSVTLNRDFGLVQGASEDAKQILEARKAKAISDERFLIEWKRRGLLSDDMKVEDELALLKAASDAAMAGFGAPPGQRTAFDNLPGAGEAGNATGGGQTDAGALPS